MFAASPMLARLLLLRQQPDATSGLDGGLCLRVLHSWSTLALQPAWATLAENVQFGVIFN